MRGCKCPLANLNINLLLRDLSGKDGDDDFWKQIARQNAAHDKLPTYNVVPKYRRGLCLKALRASGLNHRESIYPFGFLNSNDSEFSR